MKVLGATVLGFIPGSPPASHRKDKEESRESSFPAPMAGGRDSNPNTRPPKLSPLSAGGRVRFLDCLRDHVPGMSSLSTLGDLRPRL